MAEEPTKLEGSERRRPVTPPPEQRAERGNLLGRYIVLDVLGEGGMGVVYTAVDPDLDRKVAIKLLQASSTGSDSGGQAWLLREAQAMARLAHPNVINVHDVGTLPGDRVFVAMEFVDGETLRDWLDAKPRTWRDVVPVMRQAGAGLAAAHSAGLVHRDFKPDNVLVGRDGRVRVMDFGLARLDDDRRAPQLERPISSRKTPLSLRLTEVGSIVGTPAYIAPEIYDGGAADARSDQFSFGVALYEALYRTRPYEKDGTRIAAPAGAHVPARLARVVERAIARAPSERFPSMDALLVQLAIDRRPRRVVIAVAALGVTAAAIAIFATAAATRHERPCTGLRDKLTGVWDGASKQAVHRAFLATKKPFAESSYAGIERALDVYADDWVDASTQSCEATLVRRDQTEDVYAVRDACLGQRRDELGALVKLLVAADADLVEKGDKVAFGLEPVARCANIAALRGAGVPPTEPAAKIEQLHARLAEAKAALFAGRYLQAMNAATPALEIARELGYEPFLTETLIARGAALAGAANVDEAIPQLRDATWSAIRGKRDDLVSRAALAAGAATASVSGRSGEAKIWLGIGVAAAGRVGGDQLFDMQRYDVEGAIAVASADWPSAIAAHEKGFVAAEAMYGKDGAGLWVEEELLAASLAKTGSYSAARAHFEHSLALREKSVGPDHPEIALVLTSLGVCYDHLGQAQQARAAYERALVIREHTYGPNSPILLATLNNLADYHRKHDDVAAALTTIERARTIAARLGPSSPISHTVETTYAETLVAAHRFDEARAAFDALLAVEAGVQSIMLPATLASRAELALDQHAPADAARFAERSIAGYEAAGGKDNPELWRPLYLLGKAKLALADPAGARPLLERAIGIGTTQKIDPLELAPVRDALATLPR